MPAVRVGYQISDLLILVWVGGEMVTALDLKSGVRKGLRVRFPPNLPRVNCPQDEPVGLLVRRTCFANHRSDDSRLAD